MAINLVTKGCCMLHPYFNHVKEIHAVHSYEGDVTWSHILREANQVAKQVVIALVPFQV